MSWENTPGFDTFKPEQSYLEPDLKINKKEINDNTEDIIEQNLVSAPLNKSISNKYLLFAKLGDINGLKSCSNFNHKSVRDKDGNTALHLLLKYNAHISYSILFELLSLMPNSLFKLLNDKKMTPLSCYIQQLTNNNIPFDTKILKYIILKEPRAVNISDYYNLTPLQYTILPWFNNDLDTCNQQDDRINSIISGLNIKIKLNIKEKDFNSNTAFNKWFQDKCKDSELQDDQQKNIKNKILKALSK
tara:strand:- start:944 stop:1681 length:738 start_codon:yes stop_codon:yes gene_type:complete